MAEQKLDWTHKKIELVDIRKIKNFYILAFNTKDGVITSVVEIKIFEDRIMNYFLKPMTEITRTEILNVKWNVYLTLGYYIKLRNDSEYGQHITKFDGVNDKYYISYLDIDGPLSSFFNNN